ncbi:hypothetical protein SASPL_106067 [Salvia splendens]|uniref:Uncharacterized protein n=1 Tax=Salvia splendens TaxID=180675 RepID=A0A8X8YRQ6_SALSN|nr:hypothetical protein SASPL_106067 [Salvia splendens]
MAERRHGGRRGDARGGDRGGGHGDLPNEEVARHHDLRDIENDDLTQQVRGLQRNIENGDLRQQVRDLQRRLARLEKHRVKSKPERRSMDDPLFSDVFTSYDADEPLRNSNNNMFSMPMYDTPVYDEDIFYELPETPKDRKPLCQKDSQFALFFNFHFDLKMTRGTLEVLLVSAKGLDNSDFL